MRSAIRKVFWLYLILFLLLIGYLLKLCLYDSHSFVANPYNTRLSQSEEGIKRGSIYDSNGDVIAEDVLQEDGTYKRVYNNAESYAHTVGYTVKGKAGVESKYNFMLTTVSFELAQRIASLWGTEIEGNSLVLTLDDRLQQIAAEELGRQRGAIVAMEPSTGKILCMVSTPTFDSNSVDRNWEELNSDEDNSPLLNRATQGLYPPGSTFKIVTAAAAIENGNTDMTYRCTGAEKFAHSVIHCYNGQAHGNVDLTSAFAESCNTYFGTLGANLGAEKLIETANNFNFNKDINLALEYSKSTFPMTADADVNEIVETAFGQGRTLVSPLFMAMITSAVANNGMMMQPYVVDHALTPGGGVRNRTLPAKLSQIMSSSTAYKLKDLMCEVVNSGTARNAAFSIGHKTTETLASGSSVTSTKSEAIQVAGKTGTAENPHGDDHAWFVAFAPADNPEIAVAVLLENAGKGSNAIPAARRIMKEYIENIN